MHQVLYRKYRPTRLEDVVGQPQITETLARSIAQGKIAHAYLFIGPRGTGKTSVARILAHAINGFDYTVEDNYLDIIEIDAASNTGVDNIRELREKAVIAPTKGKYKVYIIDEVHMLTKSASNALLKTLEEPPAHVVFIMATTDAYKVPITISSRTQVHTFRLASPDVMLQHLHKIADQEQIDIDDDALKIIVRRGGGSFRDSLSLLDQISTLSEGRITAAALNSALGLPEVDAMATLLTAYAAKNAQLIEETLKNLLNSGIKPETIASELIETIIANPEPETLSLLSSLPEVEPPFSEAKLLVALLKTAFDSSRGPTKNPNSSQNSASPAKTAPVGPVEAVEPPSRPQPPLHPTPTPKAPETSTNPSESRQPAKPPTVLTLNFEWETFVSQVQTENAALGSQLHKVSYEVVDKTLHLYPEQKFTKTILNKSAHREILDQFLPGLDLVIHDVGERQVPEDGTLSQVSAIMGDIKEITGDSPF